MSLKDIPLEKFIGSPNNILDLLYQEPDQSLEIRTVEQFLNLPLNENYKRNQENKVNQTLKSNIPSEK